MGFTFIIDAKIVKFPTPLIISPLFFMGFSIGDFKVYLNIPFSNFFLFYVW